MRIIDPTLPRYGTDLIATKTSERVVIPTFQLYQNNEWLV
jgi:hypothetical protein